MTYSARSIRRGSRRHTRAARRLALAVRDHEIGAAERARFRAVVERSRFLLPHDSSPTTTGADASESEHDR